MTLVCLRNGSSEDEIFVKSILFSLQEFVKNYPFAFFDLVGKCRNNNYKYFGDNKEILIKNGLAENDGSIHESIRNVVLSSIDGSGLNMKFASPLKD